MRTVLSIYLPHWSTDLVRRRLRRRPAVGRPDDQGRAEPAIVLTRTDHGRAIVADCCAVAAEAGVGPGMSVTNARSLLPDVPLHDEPEHPERDAARLRALAHWAHRFAPIVEPDPPNGLLLDVTGCGRIYRGQKRLLRLVTDAIRSLGFSVRAAMAPTVAAAWAMARFGPEALTAVREGRIADVLSPLPVAALRVGDDIVHGLDEVAVDTIGDLLAIDRAELADRFDPLLLKRIDQALGQAFEPIQPDLPEEPPTVERRFAGPVQQLEAIELTVRGLLEMLVADLHQQSVGVNQLDLHVERYDAPPVVVRTRLSRPSADARHLWKLLSPKIERLNMGHGIEVIRLIATQVRRVSPHQHGAWAEAEPATASPTDESLGQFVDVVAARLGSQRVCRVQVQETHAPEAAFRLVPWRESEGNRDCVPRQVAEADRPSLLHRRPRPVEIVSLAPDGPVVSMNFDGELRRIVASVGPERIAGRWWLLPDPAAAPPVRDYFKVQDETGTWLWLYRDSTTGRWFCHGRWA